MVRMSRLVCLAVALAGLACSGPEETPNGRQPQATSSEPLAISTAADEPRSDARPTGPGRVDGSLGAEGSLDSQEGLQHLPLLSADVATGDEPASEGPQPGDLLPAAPGEPESLIHFVPFGATAAVAPGDFATWSALLEERYLGQPDAARTEALDELLSAPHIVDLTPAFINLVDGLDMADPDGVVRAGEITVDWYLAQEKYKQMVIDRSPDDLRPVMVGARLTALKAWVRWWQRTLANDTVERYRSRVDDLMRRLDKLRRERRGQL